VASCRVSAAQPPSSLETTPDDADGGLQSVAALRQAAPARKRGLINLRKVISQRYISSSEDSSGSAEEVAPNSVVVPFVVITKEKILRMKSASALKHLLYHFGNSQDLIKNSGQENKKVLVRKFLL
jgi:hypothetical protein